jgi:hypothetical protein
VKPAATNLCCQSQQCWAPIGAIVFYKTKTCMLTYK